MAFTTITLTETFDPDDPSGPLPAGQLVFTLSERIHDGAGNEVQPEPITAPLAHQYTITQSGATAGTFTLTWNGETTAAIAYNATAAAVLAALQALTGFPATATASGGALGTAAVVVTVPADAATMTDTATLTGGTLTIVTAATLSQALYANDDPTTVPVGSYYTVEFELANVGERPSIEITVPHGASGGTCTLASLS